MRLNLAVAVTTRRDEGRTVYTCSTIRSQIVSTRDVVLSAALAKLAGKTRKMLSGWIEAGKPHRASPWLTESAIKGNLVRLVLTLRDRTLRWKLFIVTWPVADRYVCMATSIPDVVFEVFSLARLEERAVEVYTQWCHQLLKEGNAAPLGDVSIEGDAWLETLDVDVDAHVRTKKPAKNLLASLFGQGPVSGSDELNKVGQCLDYMHSDFSTAIGRAELVDEIDQVLMRPDRQGVLVVGPSAVGKTAIIHECVKRRTLRYQNRTGHKPQTWWISPQRLVSGMMYLGQWEQRWLAILREATKRDHILYFEDLVGLYTAGLTRDSRLCAADVLKSYLSEHRVRILGETTPEELAVLRRRDRSLADRFHLVHVPSLSASDTLPVLIEALQRVEIQNRAFFHPSVAPLVITQQEVLAPHRAFPGKAIELVKTIGTTSAIINDNLLLYQLHQRTGTSLSLLYGHLGGQSEIADTLGSKVIGQPEAIEAMSRVVIRFTQKLHSGDRPVGVLLFLGPTGVGKTESAKALTELLFLDQSHLIRIDMNEITTPMAAEQLVGSFDAPDGRLTSAVRRQPHCVILLDEIEKAHPDVFDYLLQVLGEGRLTDARGRVVDFRSAIIILTSNLGVTHQGGQLGFDSESTTNQRQTYYRAAEQFFRPEFFNRIDEVIAFRSLSEADIKNIVLLQLRLLLSRDGLKRRHVFVRIEKNALDQVVKVGFDKQLGARAVRRALESEIVQPLGDQLSELAVDRPVLMRVSHRDGRLDCSTLDLEEVSRHSQRATPTLEVLVEKARPLIDRLEKHLAKVSESLKREQSDADLRASKLTYYALHEHVFHCNDFFKAARYRLQLAASPKLSPVQGSPTGKRNTSIRGVGTKRLLRDWMADEDLRETIQTADKEHAHLELSNDSLAHRFLQHLLLASTMLSGLDGPRRWLLGMESLSRPDDSRDRSADGSLRQRLSSYYIEPEAFFLSCLQQCLESEWQYDVHPIEGIDNYSVVSGVAVSGLLQALAGLYVTESTSSGRDLCCLRAMPIDSAISDDELPGVIAAQPLLSPEGLTAVPAGQLHSHRQIRGEIAEEVVDYVSGSRLHLGGSLLVETMPTLEAWSRWWIDTLPWPDELK